MSDEVKCHLRINFLVIKRNGFVKGSGTEEEIEEKARQEVAIILMLYGL